MPGLKMAKSSPEEMEKMLEFFNGLEEIFEGEFEQDDIFGDFDEDQREAVGKYVVEWWDKFLDGSWGRFYWGFDTLLRSAADPDLDYLEWKPEIKAILEAHEAEVEARMQRFDFTAEYIAEALDTGVNFSGFSGETCGKCGKTANVLTGGAVWVCVCDHYNSTSFSHRALHETPDLGPSLEVVRQGYRASKKYAAIASKEASDDRAVQNAG